MSQLPVNNRFKWLTAPEAYAACELWDVEVSGSGSFAVVPSLGSLVAGWVLIVPRRPMVSLREVTNAERLELINLHESLLHQLAPDGQNIYAFEHGSGHHGSVMGCGVDQAHLHLVPLPFDLVQLAASQPSPEVAWRLVDDIPLTNLPDTGEYIAVWRVGIGTGAIGTVRHPVSQWMRRLIARELGVEENWDYRTNPQTENIRKTVEAFRLTRLLTT